MKLSKYFRDIISLALIGASLSGAYFLSKKITTPPIVVSKQQSSLNLDTNFLTYLNFGQKRFYSSLFWISTILEADQEHYKGRNLNSWMFLRFKAISDLEPKFYETYNFGSLYLSIIKDDIEGASYLYSKGLEIYPDDFSLLKNASFHYYYEAQDFNKSKIILELLKKNPKSNPLMLSRLARIDSQNGKLEDAFYLLLDAYNSIPDKTNALAIKIHNDLYSLRAEIDLNCLNSKLDNCSIKDFENNLYIKKDGKFEAIKQWTPFKNKNKKGEDV